MSNRICPVCSTGSCKFRDGIMCRSWVCSEGIYKDKGTAGHKGVDKLNAAYNQSDSANAASGWQAGVDVFTNIMDMLSKYKR